jgi:hypothetical protein
MIIALCGLAGSGKTTAANHLVWQHNFARRPFAYHLKAMIAAGFGIAADVLDGPREGKEIPLDVLGGKTLREAMQSLGNEWGRELMCQDLWVRAWLKAAKTLPNVVVDDARYPNELEAVRSLGGRVIMLQRRGAGSTVNPGHASERPDLLVPDYVLNNNGSLDELREWFDAFLEHRALHGMNYVQEARAHAG